MRGLGRGRWPPFSRWVRNDGKIGWLVTMVKFPVTCLVVAWRMGRGIALLFHDHGTRKGQVVSSTPQLHFTPRKDLVPIVQEARWAPGPVWRGGKSHPTGIWYPDRPARSSVAIPTEVPGPHWLPWHILMLYHIKFVLSGNFGCPLLLFFCTWFYLASQLSLGHIVYLALFPFWRDHWTESLHSLYLLIGYFTLISC